MTETTTPELPARLPLWRLILGLSVFAAFAGILIFLAPVYLDDLRLHSYVGSLEKNPGVTPDEALRDEVLARARALDLPVRPGDIRIAHTGRKTKIEMRYVVEMNLIVFPVDLHFPTIR